MLLSVVLLAKHERYERNELRLWEGGVQTIWKRLYHFWKIIRNEDAPVDSLRNICQEFSSRYAGSFTYIDQGQS